MMFVVAAVVHEGCALGSDGESIEVSPCTSDQTTASTEGGGGHGEGTAGTYIPQVKLRHKPGGLAGNRHKWSEVFLRIKNYSLKREKIVIKKFRLIFKSHYNFYLNLRMIIFIF
jgi:hypothetical protein